MYSISPSTVVPLFIQPNTAPTFDCPVYPVIVADVPEFVIVKKKLPFLAAPMKPPEFAPAATLPDAYVLSIVKVP